MPGVPNEQAPGVQRNTLAREADARDKAALLRRIQTLAAEAQEAADTAARKSREITALFDLQIVAGAGLSGGGRFGDAEDITLSLTPLHSGGTVIIPALTGGGTPGEIVYDEYGRITSHTDPT